MRAPVRRCRIDVSIFKFILLTPKIRAAFMIPMMRASIKIVVTCLFIVIIIYINNIKL